MPSFLEALLHVSPLTSGLALAALTIGWPITASQSGRLYLRYGFRTTALVGSALAVLGVAALVWVSTDPTVVGVGLSCFVVGGGLGLTSSPTLIAAQSSVGLGRPRRRHRRQPVLAVDGQRRRRRRPRRRGQRPG